MSDFNSLETYYMNLLKDGMGQSESPMSLNREPDPNKLAHLYPMDKDSSEGVSEEAKLAVQDDGLVEGSDEFLEAVQQMQASINKKNNQRKQASASKAVEESLEKGKRGDLFWNDPFAVATALLIKLGRAVGGDSKEEGTSPPWGKGEFKRGSPLARMRDRIAEAIASKMGWQFGGASSVQAMQLSDDENLEKISPGLERLLAFGAGWALSGDVVNRDVPADLVREWERAINRQASESERRAIERKIKSRLKKSEDGAVAFENLTDFFLEKDHAPVPPRIGLMWDAVKHRWTRPERIGRTVWELSGHKRIRGTGTGVHERSVKVGGVGGRGAGSASAGRRFRSIGDSGKLSPHESKHPAFRRLKSLRRKRKEEYAKKKSKK